VATVAAIAIATSPSIAGHDMIPRRSITFFADWTAGFDFVS
jgi:hypothetical protein